MPATKTKRPRKAKPRPAPLPAKAPDPAHPETVLVLRTCRKDMTSHNGFKWPKSGPVECPDWDPAPKCGNGLHGLAWGEGDWCLLGNEQTDKWLVVEVAAADLVKIDDEKVKFKRGVVVFCGQMADAVTRVLCSPAEMARMISIAGERATGYSSAAAATTRRRPPRGGTRSPAWQAWQAKRRPGKAGRSRWPTRTPAGAFGSRSATPARTGSRPTPGTASRTRSSSK